MTKPRLEVWGRLRGVGERVLIPLSDAAVSHMDVDKNQVIGPEFFYTDCCVNSDNLDAVMIAMWPHKSQ